MNKIIFHIDVNSAFLSWEACYRVDVLHEEVDLRDIPSVIGGDQSTRHGIVLAKSTSAKKYGIQTGEPLIKAMQKCPGLISVKPHYDVYVENSKKFISLLNEFAPVVEQYSIDEAFCDMSGTETLYGDLYQFAYKLKDIIHERLGFTVNIGISNNKLLAKMASDFEKPDKVHTLYPDEISKKLWPLPVSDLLFVGKQTAKRLNLLGIHTIGELAGTDVSILRSNLKRHGEDIWNYANGYDTTDMNPKTAANKGYSNSITLNYDVTDRDTALKVILSLCETVSARLRADKAYISVVSVTIVDYEFNKSQKQVTLNSSTNITEKIYGCCVEIFDKFWNHAPIRLLGVSAGKAVSDSYTQYNMFDMYKYDKLSKLDKAIDNIRNKYGDSSIKRACFLEDDNSMNHTGLSKAKKDASASKNSAKEIPDK